MIFFHFFLFMLKKMLSLHCRLYGYFIVAILWYGYVKCCMTTLQLQIIQTNKNTQSYEKLHRNIVSSCYVRMRHSQ